MEDSVEPGMPLPARSRQIMKKRVRVQSTFSRSPFCHPTRRCLRHLFTRQSLFDGGVGNGVDDLGFVPDLEVSETAAPKRGGHRDIVGFSVFQVRSKSGDLLD